MVVGQTVQRVKTLPDRLWELLTTGDWRNLRCLSFDTVSAQSDIDISPLFAQPIYHPYLRELSLGGFHSLHVREFISYLTRHRDNLTKLVYKPSVRDLSTEWPVLSNVHYLSTSPTMFDALSELNKVSPRHLDLSPQQPKYWSYPVSSYGWYPGNLSSSLSSLSVLLLLTSNNNDARQELIRITKKAVNIEDLVITLCASEKLQAPSSFRLVRIYG
jgi:hypothetical protein